ncbi:MAG: hypothetical protein ACD_51C00093G0002 [uncultured bacterium]|nr:MAG: hypothetical protein ACD_51C00093G0002 [uncultured bacterium]OGJ48535.1 MAG: hypothetical protein A2244_02485 [Candidatus Peregrinibacteria bacterium RIFOXYA2_FULL_41_18]OGJ48867.1 MAG: hypothetical protein A2344_02885 [Candidatus Peregrinibacteria bacterium RIFOXYB12_FULL_41_12]OGJ53203.1 MAG: hypothetical protein A2448_00855 [Candidatus Peregrinibacteria bacterium RIFOXYC2_FULL_41_22]OGJ53927.1 MAG: hypothetical protein A2336_00545 [Candidatus Peregrinibacteria bacterium RIFOXYB2_FULL
MKTIKVIIKSIIVVAITALLAGWYFIIGPHSDLEGKDFNLESNGLWLQHAWVGNEQETAVIEDLALKLAKYDIKYVYVHTGPFDSDGTIPEERYKFASEFLKILKAKNPDIVALAWVGQVRSELDIDDSIIRKNITTTCGELISETGFDGIHYDIEPIAHEDTAFLTLLEETRTELGDSAFISVATDEWQPSLLSDLAGEILDQDIKSYWETDYFKSTAETADQIVIMTYDTSLGETEHYEWLVEQQIIYLTQILVDSDAQLLIGIPTYEDDKESFDPEVENMETGLKGVVQGLNNKRTNVSVFTGVAIYADWETDESEWGIYENLWQGIQ